MPRYPSSCSEFPDYFLPDHDTIVLNQPQPPRLWSLPHKYVYLAHTHSPSPHFRSHFIPKASAHSPDRQKPLHSVMLKTQAKVIWHPKSNTVCPPMLSLIQIPFRKEKKRDFNADKSENKSFHSCRFMQVARHPNRLNAWRGSHLPIVG